MGKIGWWNRHGLSANFGAAQFQSSALSSTPHNACGATSKVYIGAGIQPATSTNQGYGTPLISCHWATSLSGAVSDILKLPCKWNFETNWRRTYSVLHQHRTHFSQIIWWWVFGQTQSVKDWWNTRHSGVEKKRCWYFCNVRKLVPWAGTFQDSAGGICGRKVRGCIGWKGCCF